MKGTPFGRYRLLEVLGAGGMGEVWRAYDTSTERSVAVKVLPTRYADDAAYQERFRREARSAASLDDPHVIPIYDFGVIDGRLYVAMRIVKGRDLQSVIADGPLDPIRAVTIVEQIASALHAAHRIGLVHRDVKPHNILIAEDDFAYLIDFGIARIPTDTRLTGTGGFVGSPSYMAPERFTDGTTHATADTYALTCVLFEALTARLPFPANGIQQLIAAHLLEPPPQASAVRASLPAAMDHVIARGLAKDPGARFASAKEMARAARDALVPRDDFREPRTTPVALRQPARTPEPVLALRYAARSDRGLDRPTNDDSVYAGARLLAVADGSHDTGAVASRLVIAALARLDNGASGGDLENALDVAVRLGNTDIGTHVDADAGLVGMGTTVTALLFAGNRIGLVHVGDSRCYLLRHGELRQITKDETGGRDPHAHTRRVLTGRRVELSRATREARVGDRYLLCTRGLSGPVGESVIAEALQIADVDESANRLIEIALHRGGPENVTVVVADVVASPTAGSP